MAKINADEYFWPVGYTCKQWIISLTLKSLNIYMKIPGPSSPLPEMGQC